LLFFCAAVDSDADLMSLSVIYQELHLYEDASQQTTDVILASTSNLSEIEDQLEEISKALQVKLAGEDDSGSNRIVRVKQAILQLQQELRDMHQHMGMASEELIERRKQQMYFMQRNEQRRRHHKSLKDD
jgi:16S rRNA G1207 methylase RsmC